MAPRPPLDPDQLPLGVTPRTVFVTGKGGVGKSTVAAALALAWRDAGARTLLIEIEGQASAAALLDDRKVGYEPVPLGQRLFAARITLSEALREYARLRLKVRLVADRLVGNPVMEQFAQAAPGFRELLVLGKLWATANARDGRGRPCWDAIVVDAPATGHGLGLLGMAGVVARMFPVGPIAAEAKAVDAFVRDEKRTGVVLVALAEELPVTETISLHEQLASQGVSVTSTILNALLVDRFSDAEGTRLHDLLEGRGDDLPAPTRSAVHTASWEHERCADQARERERLQTALGSVDVLPFMFVPHFGREHVHSLAGWMTPAGQTVLHDQLAGATDGPAAAARVHAASTAGEAGS